MKDSTLEEMTDRADKFQSAMVDPDHRVGERRQTRELKPLQSDDQEELGTLEEILRKSPSELTDLERMLLERIWSEVYDPLHRDGVAEEYLKALTPQERVEYQKKAELALNAPTKRINVGYKKEER